MDMAKKGFLIQSDFSPIPEDDVHNTQYTQGKLSK